MAKVKITIYRKVLQSYAAEVEVRDSDFGSVDGRAYLSNTTKDDLSSALAQYAPDDAWEHISSDYDTNRKDEFKILPVSGLVFENGQIIKVE